MYQGIPLMPTFHPAYLLRNPAEKKQVWKDVQMIMEHL
jgi:uracil-DNA glycosylase family 4